MSSPVARTRLIAALLAAAGAIVAASPARAQNQVSILPDATTASVGEILGATLRVDFDAATIGGGVDLLYDPELLAWRGFAFAPGLDDDPELRLQPSDTTRRQPVRIGFGQLQGLAPGSRDVGRMLFEVLAPGTTRILAARSSGGAGPFLAAGAGAAELAVGFADSGPIELRGPVLGDRDGDGVADALDNCLIVANATQGDADADGIGNACECGDASGDGVLNSVDARLIQRCAVGLFPCPALCDVTGEGACNSIDARLVQRLAVGFLDKPALGCPQRPRAP